MAPSSAPKPPRIAPNVRIESILAPIFAALYITIAWNFLVVPNAPVGTVNFFAALGGTVALATLGTVVGYAAGHGIARQSLAENEAYGEKAAEFLEAVEEWVDATTPDEPPAKRRGGGGQG